MSLLLQISDPHFGTERPEVVEALLRLAADQRPAIAVISGDITQRAREAQFAAARAFVDRLGVAKTLVIPGNHDIPLFNLPARLFSPYARYRRFFGNDLEPVIDTPDWLVIGVKTTRRRRHKDGEVSTAQIESVAERLGAAEPRQLRVVVTHQPLLATRRSDRANVLHGAQAAIHRWSAAGADLVLSGHIHLPFVEPFSEQVEGLPRLLWAVEAGTAVSRRVREGADNSVNLIRRDDVDVLAHCIAERWDFSPISQRFERVKASRLRVDRGPTTAA